MRFARPGSLSGSYFGSAAAMDAARSVSISVSFAGVQQRPGPSVRFCRAWSRTAPTGAERSAADLESVLGKPSRVRISYPPPMI